MKKQILLLTLLAIWLIACGTKETSTTEETPQEKQTMADKPETSPTVEPLEEEKENKTTDRPRGSIYRIDGAHPGIASEWLQVAFSKDPDQFKVEGIWYWNTVDETKMKVKIISQEYHDGEISGFTLQILFPENTEPASLGLIEDQANVTFSDGTFNDFIYESSEE